MNRLMKNVVSPNGTAGAAQLSNKDVVGKTGTTQNWDDLWFIGLTEDFVSGVWIGYTERDRIVANPSSAKLWYNVIGEYANSLETDAEYPTCESVICAPICKKTGMIAGEGCEKGEKGYWKSDNAPRCSGCKPEETTEDPSATNESGEAPSSTASGGTTPKPTDPPVVEPTDPPEPPPTDPPTDPPAAPPADPAA